MPCINGKWFEIRVNRGKTARTLATTSKGYEYWFLSRFEEIGEMQLLLDRKGISTSDKRKSCFESLSPRRKRFQLSHWSKLFPEIFLSVFLWYKCNYVIWYYYSFIGIARYLACNLIYPVSKITPISFLKVIIYLKKKKPNFYSLNLSAIIFATLSLW